MLWLSTHILTNGYEKLVVVGDQSSGKSSVLESVTGFSFPRAAGLCTRYVTQITCCRDTTKSINISIIPRPDGDDELKSRLLAFRRRFTTFDNDDLAKVFEDVREIAGHGCFSADSKGQPRHGYPHDD